MAGLVTGLLGGLGLGGATSSPSVVSSPLSTAVSTITSAPIASVTPAAAPKTGSSTVLIGQAPVNLGPLTTVFTPPPACTVAVAECKTCDTAFLAQSCDGLTGPVDVASCWPPTTSGAPVASAPLHGYGFYSPGIECPAGYATACSATGGAGGSAGWPVQFKLLDGETAVGCCPAGFACGNVNGQTCLQVATATTVSTVTCELGKSGGFGFMTVPDTSASITAYSIFAPMIQINWQSSDRPDSASPTTAPDLPATSAAPSEPSAIEPPPTQTSVPTDGLAVATGEPTVPANGLTPSDTGLPGAGSPGGFPMAATIGIAIGGGLGAMALLMSSVLLCRRHWKKKREEQDAVLLKLDAMYDSQKPLPMEPGPSRYPQNSWNRGLEEYHTGNRATPPGEYSPYRAAYRR